MAGKNLRRSGDAPTIVIRRDEGEEPAHHGGAWKVAYADFMTAMMAFFLLLWLLNATTEEQRTGLADYFAPTNLFGRSVSGSGKPFGGKTPNDEGTSVSSDGSPQVMTGKKPPVFEEDDLRTDQQAASAVTGLADNPPAAQTAGNDDGSGATKLNIADQKGQGDQAVLHGGDYAAASLAPPPPNAPAHATQPAGATGEPSPAQAERQALNQAGAKLLDAIRRDPALQDVAGQIMIDNTPEGLRIQVVDAANRPMFALGSTTPTPRVRALMEKVVPALSGLPNQISIAGHTDALAFRGSDKDNWDLSVDRANATRHILVDAGLAPDRIRQVNGDADRDLLDPNNPLSPANRRITITVLRTAADTRGPAAARARPATMPDTRRVDSAR